MATLVFSSTEFIYFPNYSISKKSYPLRVCTFRYSKNSKEQVPFLSISWYQVIFSLLFLIFFFFWQTSYISQKSVSFCFFVTDVIVFHFGFFRTCYHESTHVTISVTTSVTILLWAFLKHFQLTTIFHFLPDELLYALSYISSETSTCIIFNTLTPITITFLNKKYTAV